MDNSLPYNKLGDLVYLRTDKDQLPRIITAIIIRPTGTCYELSQGTVTSNHYDFEFSTDRDVLLKTSE